MKLYNVQTQERADGHQIGKTKSGNPIWANPRGNWIPIVWKGKIRADRDGNYITGK